MFSHIDATVDVFFVGPKSDGEHIWLLVPRIVWSSIKFAMLVAAKRFDVIHVHTSFASKSLMREGALMLATRLTSSPVLVTFHGWSSSLQNNFNAVGFRLFKFAFGRTDRFIVLAQDFKQALQTMGFHQPVLVESTFVDDAVFSNVAEQDIPLPNGCMKPFSILFLSRVLREKGIFVLLECFAKLKEKYSDTRLVIAGEGNDLAEAKEFVRKHSLTDVEFTGFIEGDHKKRMLLQADAFVLPTSYGEGLPISMLEAMMCGLPVVSRPVGGIKDFFENERMGVLIEELNPDSYRDALDRLITDKEHRRTIKLFNHRYARNRFFASTAAQRLLEVYDDMTTNRGK